MRRTLFRHRTDGRADAGHGWVTATREIRKREGEGRRVPIVALTASAMTDELERCLAVGMDGLLTKPLEFERLREALIKYSIREPVAEGDLLPHSSDGSRDVRAAVVSCTPRLGVAVGEGSDIAEPIDLKRLRSAIGDDDEFAEELCRSYVNTPSRS